MRPSNSRSCSPPPSRTDGRPQPLTPPQQTTGPQSAGHRCPQASASQLGFKKTCFFSFATRQIQLRKACKCSTRASTCSARPVQLPTQKHVQWRVGGSVLDVADCCIKQIKTSGKRHQTNSEAARGGCRQCHVFTPGRACTWHNRSCLASMRSGSASVTAVAKPRSACQSHVGPHRSG